MTDLTPALTPDQWERLRAYTARFYGPDSPEWMLTAYLELSPAELTEEGLPATAGYAEPFALAAVALAALPDGDPRKLTAEMVEAIRKCASSHAHKAWGTDDMLNAEAAFANDAADVIATLLPPRPRAGEGG